MLKKYFYSRGKFLITGEYVILDGALGLALSTRYGQLMKVYVYNKRNILIWKSFNNKNKIWFEAYFEIPSLKIIKYSDNKIVSFLKKILESTKILKNNFLNDNNSFLVKTYLEFPKNWGLGSSSTLINNIAKWANINPFKLFWSCFSGSGYDIACAKYNRSLLYKVINKKPQIFFFKFNPNYKKYLYFIFLNIKKDSNEAINMYNNFSKIKKNINTISLITKKIIFCRSLKKFEELISYHEALISNILNIPTIKEKYFSDYPGIIKSLGAWGGDFILVSFRKNMKEYFFNKGMYVIIPFNNIIYNNF